MQYSMYCLEAVQILNTREKYPATWNWLFERPIRTARLRKRYTWATSRHTPRGQLGDGGWPHLRQLSQPVVSAPPANAGARVAGASASLCRGLDRATRSAGRIPGSARLWRGLGAVSTEHGAGLGYKVLMACSWEGQGNCQPLDGKRGARTLKGDRGESRRT